jgi:hypothetical protein
MGWTGVTGPDLNGVGDRAATRVTGQTAEEYLSNSLYNPHDYLVPGFGPLMVQFQDDDPSVPTTYMTLEQNQAVVAFLCSQTSTGESACDLENLAAITVGSN